MKHFTLFCLLLACLLFSLIGCRRQYSENRPPLEKWLAEDTEAALKEIIGDCMVLYKEKHYDSVFNTYREVLLNFPNHPAGNGDTISQQVGTVISMLANAAQQKKMTPEYIVFLDSLEQFGSVYLKERCKYYLLSYRAYSLFLLDKKESFELAKQFLEWPPCPDPWQEMATCNQIAEICQHWGGDAEMYLGLQERAVAAVRLCGNYTDFMRMLGTMGYFYRRVGMYDKAVEHLQEAYERYLQEGQGQKNVFNVRVMADLSNLYSQLRLYSKALDLNACALDACAPMNMYNVMGDLYRMRSGIFDDFGQPDSCLYYNRRSIDEMEKSSYRQGLHVARSGYVASLVKYSDLYPDSLIYARKELESLYADSIDIAALFRVNDCFSLGLALTKTGDLQAGIELMKQATAKYEDQEWNDKLNSAYSELMKLYVKEDMKAELAALFPAYAAMRDTMERQDKITATMAADIRYETGRKEQENRALTAEVSLKERTLVYTRVILLLSVFLLIGAICLIVQYRRMRRQERETHLNEMNRLLSAQRELNRRNEALSIELEQTTHTEVIDNVRQQLNPILLSGDDEVRFRQSFAALYPRYLPRLRARCPEITKSDELVCMLIYLKQNTDEVSLALGISRASVNSARSRIRKKLGMQKEESLDEYLQGIW